MTHSKTFLLLTGLILNIPLGSYADSGQTTSTKIEFTYDSAGNRILRQLNNDVTPQRSKNLSNQKSSISDNVNIYPNPVESTMNVDVAGYDLNHSYDLGIYGETGVLLMEKRLTAPQNIIDLNSLSSGSYVVVITKDGELVSQGYKIIKL